MIPNPIVNTQRRIQRKFKTFQLSSINFAIYFAGVVIGMSGNDQQLNWIIDRKFQFSKACSKIETHDGCADKAIK